ncbi:hypothetical protein SAMN05444266_103105 [Chitinophaga jiangningensis]|uniref:Uncharacterized protein n=1 Tax=Chitinophaga jiangningensis TaxID=1419482 RepID=A0A1M7A318_9BACT|nr:hypothetical protein SAMN05444266_103105 [Chitinophaga jiangningensis]
MNGPLKRLGFKEANRLIKESEGKLSLPLKYRYHYNIYELSTGEAIVLFEKHVFLYSSVKNVESYYQ